MNVACHRYNAFQNLNYFTFGKEKQPHCHKNSSTQQQKGKFCRQKLSKACTGQVPCITQKKTIFCTQKKKIQKF